MTDEAPNPVYSLHHLSGTRKGEEDRFQVERVTIGRGRNNHCTFDPERERSVSHRHCEIRIEEEAPVIYDIGSLNGTYLNGRRVRRATLSDGDEIGLGREGPRLRFMLRSGRTPDAILPGDQPGAPKIGGTSEEAKPTGLEARAEVQRERRYRRLLIGLGALVIALVIAGFMVIERLSGRIDELEHDPGSRPVQEVPAQPPARPGEAAGTSDPGAADSTPATATLEVLIRITDEAGAEVFNHVVGSGACLASGQVLTTLPVFDAAQAHLKPPPSVKDHKVRLMVAPGGNRRAAVLVTHVIGPEDMGPIGYSDLAVLVLAEEGKTTLPRRLLASPGSRGLRSHLPGLSAQEVTISQMLDAQGAPISGAEPPSLFRASPLPPMPGTPLFSGDAVAALSLGAIQPGLAVAAPALRAFLDEASRATPHPIKYR